MRHRHCNRLSPKCKSQHNTPERLKVRIVTDYRLNANHNIPVTTHLSPRIVTDYRLNANHNSNAVAVFPSLIVPDYRLNANHNKHLC